jgi:hypothetical protein
MIPKHQYPTFFIGGKEMSYKRKLVIPLLALALVGTPINNAYADVGQEGMRAGTVEDTDFPPRTTPTTRSGERDSPAVPFTQAQLPERYPIVNPEQKYGEYNGSELNRFYRTLTKEMRRLPRMRVDDLDSILGGLEDILDKQDKKFETLPNNPGVRYGDIQEYYASAGRIWEVARNGARFNKTSLDRNLARNFGHGGWALDGSTPSLQSFQGAVGRDSEDKIGAIEYWTTRKLLSQIKDGTYKDTVHPDTMFYLNISISGERAIYNMSDYRLEIVNDERNNPFVQRGSAHTFLKIIRP